MREQYSLTVTMVDLHREELSQPEFAGDGLLTLEDAINAANEAVDYIGGGVWMIDIYCGEKHVGYVQDGKFFENLD